MIRRRKGFLAVAGVAALLMAMSLTLPLPQATWGGALTDLGVSFNPVTGINDSGQVVGFTTSAAYLYSNGTTTNLGTLPGDTFSEAYGINDSGQVVGWSESSAGSGIPQHAFLYSNGVMTDLGALNNSYSAAYGINDSGQIVGWSDNQAFLYSNGVMTGLGTLGGSKSEAFDINNSGQIVGWSYTASGATHAFLYSNGVMNDLGTLGGTTSQAIGINDSGQIVGWSTTASGTTDAFLYDNGVMTDLGTLVNVEGSDTTQPASIGINNSGQVVFDSTTASGATDAFLYDNGTLTDLTTVSGISGEFYAFRINDNGLVAGVGSTDVYTYDVNSYSRYDFTFYYNNGSGDYYTGYAYAPTSFETSQGGFLSVGTYLYDQPEALMSSGYTLNGGYYYLTAITDGFACTYDKQSYITSYYDADTAKSSLAVNSDGSATAANIYVADRTAAWETGYAISGSLHDTFSVYKEADVTIAAASSASLSVASSTSSTSSSISAAESQAVWAAYYSQGSSLLEEEK